MTQKTGGEWLKLCLMGTTAEPAPEASNHLVQALHQLVYGVED